MSAIVFILYKLTLNPSNGSPSSFVSANDFSLNKYFTHIIEIHVQISGSNHTNVRIFLRGTIFADPSDVKFENHV